MAKRRSKKEKERAKRIATIISLGAIFFLILFVWLLTSARRYNFVGVVFFPLWYVALGLGVIAAIVAVWIFHKKMLPDAKKEKKVDIGLGLIVILFVFMITGILFAHLNHIFDQNEPERYVVVIEDKAYNSGGRKSPGYYEFRVTIDGETEDITVPRRHAYQFQEGDLYVVEYRKGAFNEPYYIGVGAP